MCITMCCSRSIHGYDKFFTGCGPLSFTCGSHGVSRFCSGYGPLSMGLKEGFLSTATCITTCCFRSIHGYDKFFTNCGPLSFTCGSHGVSRFSSGCGPVCMGLNEGFLRQPCASSRAAPAGSMGMTNSSLAVVHYPLPVVHTALADSPLAVVHYPWV